MGVMGRGWRDAEAEYARVPKDADPYGDAFERADRKLCRALTRGLVAAVNAVRRKVADLEHRPAALGAAIIEAFAEIHEAHGEAMRLVQKRRPGHSVSTGNPCEGGDEWAYLAAGQFTILPSAGGPLVLMPFPGEEDGWDRDSRGRWYPDNRVPDFTNEEARRPLAEFLDDLGTGAFNVWSD